MDKTLNWQGIAWKKDLIIPRMHEPKALKRLTNRAKARRAARELFAEDDATCAIEAPFGLGKVTDAGYDAFACVSTAIRADRDFDFEADVTVRRFLREPGPNNWEAFGMFVRSTLGRHARTGLYYANMAAVGGYYGRYNVFGRSGIAGERIDRVRSFTLYEQANRPDGAFRDTPLRYRIAGDAPEVFHLSLSRRGDRFHARMTDAEGRDVLSPALNGGEAELSDSGIVPDARLGYGMRLPGAMGGGRLRRVHLGFFAAGGSEIAVDKASVRLTLRERAEARAEAAPPEAEDTPWQEAAFDVRSEVTAPTRLWFAAPDGREGASGSREDPLDIHTAVARCGCGEGVRLCPGTYHLDRSLTIGPDQSGTPRGRKRLTGEGTILDLGGGGNALDLLGDCWIIENLKVTNSQGIRIEGSFNWLRGCAAFGNLETGILIRHHDNASPRALWPRGNRVEDCVSHENRDPSECNADGFACKVAAGPGNAFVNCLSFLNSDDGFDLYSKNRAIGAVSVEGCRSCLNGFRRGPDGALIPTAGNGNGFKLGGSGMYVAHRVKGCFATGNKRDGITSNSNPWLHLEGCTARNNGRKNISYGYYEGARTRHRCELLACDEGSDAAFDPLRLARELLDEAR